MKTYLINLYNAYSRRTSTVAELDRNNICHELFYGFNNNQFKLKPEVKHLSAGAVGAFVSHYTALLNASNVQDDLVLILEDDVKLVESFIPKLQKSLESLPQNWDIAFLGWFLQFNGGIERDDGIGHWVRVRGSLGMYSYIVKRSSIHKILSELYHIRDHVDKQVALAIERNRLSGFWLREPLVTCKGFESQIEK